MKHLNRLNLANTALYTLSGAILLSCAVAFYLFLGPVNILSNWTIVTNSQTYRVGDTLSLESKYSKHKQVIGDAHRYLECKDAHGNYIRYQLSEATADHAPGTNTGTGAINVIPKIAPVPTQCHIAIVINYKNVYGFRTVSVFNQSRPDFTVNP